MNETVLTWIVFILAFGGMVLIHEFGHFIVSKKFGIRVEEFGLGIPPRVFGKQIGETLYSLNWLPFGGFVKVTGEDPEEAGSSDSRSFALNELYSQYPNGIYLY
jgi:regulator of sigma E protease